MADVPGWDEVHATITELVALVGERLPLLTTRQVPAHPRQLAAGYLARCRRLVIGIEVLIAAEMEDLVGALLRICFELWLHGLWTLYGDAQEVLDAHNDDFTARMNRIVTRTGLDVPLIEVEPEITKMPSVEQLAKEVGEALVREGDPAGAQMPYTYDAIYRMESARGVHGGMAAVLQHLVDQETYWEVREKRYEVSDGSGELLWAAVLVGFLARRVFVAFGVGVQELDSLLTPIRELHKS